MNAHSHEVIRRGFFGKEIDHGPREFGAHAVNAESHEFIGAEMAITELAHVPDELTRDVMNREREQLLLSQVGIAERFHSQHIFGAGGEAELALAFAVVEAAVKTHDPRIAAQLEVGGSVLGAGEVRVEAVKVTDFVRVTPRLVMAPAGALYLEIDRGGLASAREFCRPLPLDWAVGGAAGNARGQNPGHQNRGCEPHREFTHGVHLSTCEDVRAGHLFHADCGGLTKPQERNWVARLAAWPKIGEWRARVRQNRENYLRDLSAEG